MGMYTEFYFRANIKDGPVADWLDRQINGDAEEWFEYGYDSHPFFDTPQRWRFVFCSGGAVYQESRLPVFRPRGSRDGVNSVYANELSRLQLVRGHPAVGVGQRHWPESGATDALLPRARGRGVVSVVERARKMLASPISPAGLRVMQLRTVMPELIDELEDLRLRLKAFGKDCVTHGDMTPGAKRMLDRILEGES